MATHESLNLTRRHLLQGAGAAMLALPSWGRLAHAQAASKMVLGTWGGDYSKLLTKNVETPHLAARKIQVEHAIGGDPERRAKMMAEARLPRGTSDLQALSAAHLFELILFGKFRAHRFDVDGFILRPERHHRAINYRMLADVKSVGRNRINDIRHHIRANHYRSEKRFFGFDCLRRNA